MSDMCFEDFDYDREDDLYSQAAELEEEKLTSDNNERDEILLCDNNEFCDRRSIAGLCTNKNPCNKHRKTSPVS